jgi:hypothetical protein
LLAGQVRAAIAAGAFRSATNPDQFLQDLHGILLGYHHRARLLHDSEAQARARRALGELVDRALRPRGSA